MKFILLVSFVVFASLFVSVSAVDLCPNHPGYVPQNTSLFFCSQYSGVPSCCTQTDDSLLNQKYNLDLAPFFKGNCLADLRELFCTWQCDPNQYQFVDATLNVTSNITTLDIYWNIFTANAIYDTCKGECYLTSKTANWGQMRPNSTNFVEFFDSVNDPLYQPSSTLPITNFWVSTDPSEGKNLTDLLPADHANPCGPQSTTSQSSTSSTTSSNSTTSTSTSTSSSTSTSTTSSSSSLSPFSAFFGSLFLLFVSVALLV